MKRGHVAAVLGAAGVLMSAGGQLHPRGTGETVDDYLAVMLGSDTWVVAHVLSLAALLVAVVGFAMARRSSAFGRGADRVLTVTTVAWAVAAVELVPHVLAVRDRAALEDHRDTPILDLHLILQMGASPLFGFTAALLALAVAREAGTVPAKVLAALAVIGGLCYGAAGPLVSLTDSVAVTPLFIGQAGVAIWLLGTAVRLGFGGRDDADATADTRQAAPSAGRSRGAALRNALVVGLGATAFLAVPVPDADAAVSPGRPGGIVFVATPGDGTVYLARVDGAGGGFRPLTTPVAGLGNPAVSPDGTRVAFTRDDGDGQDIWVLPLAGGQATRLTTSPGADTQPAWSPDGTRIYFTSTRSGQGHVFVMKADGTGQVDLTPGPDSASLPAPSPDGRRIAFASTRAGNWDLYLLPAAGGAVKRLTSHTRDELDPAWSPDGRTLAFTGTWHDGIDIYAIDADGTDPRRLTESSGFEQQPTFSPDGRQIAYSASDGGWGLWVMPVNGATHTRLIGTNFDAAPDWGPQPTTCQGRAATITGTAGNDVLRGTPGPDVIAGLGGHDTLSGLDGADVICGGEGNDTVVGGAGADRLDGGAGRDVLRALDGSRDLRIGCGDGRDPVPTRDRVDPAAVGC